MALQEAETVELTEEFLIEEMAEAMESVEDQVTVDGAKRRLDRQLGLLRALPEGWRVTRRKPGTAGVRIFYVEDQTGVRASATVARDHEARLCVEWAPSGGRSAGDAWAHGIAALFAAIAAEAGIAPREREIH